MYCKTDIICYNIEKPTVKMLFGRTCVFWNIRLKKLFECGIITKPSKLIIYINDERIFCIGKNARSFVSYIVCIKQLAWRLRVVRFSARLNAVHFYL